MSYEQYRPNSFSFLPMVVKNLLIINGLFFFATIVLGNQFGINLQEMLGLHYPTSEAFRPYQLVTYMFMHGGLFHIIINMYVLWMLGNSLENLWGPKRFLTYYMITGIGAGIVQILVTYIRLVPLFDQVSQNDLNLITTNGYDIFQSGRHFINPFADQMNVLINSATVGASGAVFGILLAFGMLFPNTELIIIPIPIPIKAKWFVIGYGTIELFSGIANNPNDNVAHFAHLGGMLFGFIMIKYWQRRSNHFY